MSANIEELIPHRYPFIFVDTILSADEHTVIATKTFDREKDKILTGSFPDHGFIPGMIIIESMAQSGGAGIKQIGLASGFFGLAAMTDVQFFRGVSYGEEIKYEVKNIRVSNRIIKQSGIAYCNGVKVAEATWVCGRID
jgi:3-hydroxyacyl-[acyl-carrier-protein] dehydratase